MASGTLTAAQFCDDSVPLDTADAFARWAGRLLREPAPAMAHKSLELRISEALGTHMVARRSFASGDVVLSELPVVRIPEAAPRVKQQVEMRYGSHAGFMSPAAAVDWLNLEEDALEAALTLFFAHPLMVSGETDLARQGMAACEDMIEWHKPLQKRISPERLVRFLHVVDLNIHKDDEREHASYAGIFVLGSKFTHSCAPNCSWSFNADMCLEYQAIRAISPGEVLTFSYIGNGMNLIQSTLERRHRLASLWFCCQCVRCNGPDFARQLGCPRCKALRCMPVYDEGGSTELRRWRGNRPLRELIPDARTWKCSACGAATASGELPLGPEKELTQLIPRVMEWPSSTTSVDAANCQRLCGEISDVVGSMHWTWVLATFAWLQKWLVVLRNEPVINVREERLQAASASIARWFETCAPENIEQRLSALFLAVRLADILGGSLQAWGYNHDDPLGDGGVSAKRLEDNGWNYRGEEVSGLPEVHGTGRCEVRGSNTPSATRPLQGKWS